MRIFPPPIEIGDTEGFNPAKDLFDRVHLGSGLTNLVGAVTEPLVLAIDGQWGSGKTTFLKMWAGHLRNAGFPVIFFDAFENDYSEDAFNSLAGQIIALMAQKMPTKKSRAFIDKATATGKVLLRSSLKIAVKAATLGALEGSVIDEVAKAASGELEAFEDRYVGELLTREKEHRDTIQAFRDGLADLPALLAGPVPVGGAARPLIFIIDELDRCRPTFALQVLERIKHFFTATNVHFVLGAHMGQLRNSVVAAYGTEIDAQTYLQKFVHVTFPLVDEGRARHERIPGKYVSYLAGVLEFRPADREDMKQAVGTIVRVAETRDLSLREIERVMSLLALSLAFSREASFRLPSLIAGLCILRVIEPRLFVAAKAGTLTFEEATTALGFNHEAEPDDERRVAFEKKWWRYCLDPEAPPDLVADLDPIRARYVMADRFRLVRLMANQFIPPTPT